MKKIYLLTLLLIYNGLCNAQILNGNFESWSVFSLETPNGWFTSAREALEIQLQSNATMATPAHSGNYAIKLETIVTATDTVFAYFNNTQGDPMDFKGGVPYSMKPDSFFCWAKLGIAAPDTGIYLVIFKKNGIPISTNLGHIKGNSPTTWTKLGFKLNPMAVNPDTVIIAAASSNAFTGNGITNGSFIIFDDLSFNTSQPIPDGGFENWTVVNADMPDGWNSDNIASILLENKKQIEKSTDAFKGNYALKMTTQYIAENDWGINWLGNGYADNWHDSGIFPYNQQTDTLYGWYKYFPKTSDTAGLYIDFSQNGSFFYSYGMILTPATNWTKFQLDLNLPAIPDSATLTFFSSQWPINVSDTGSVLFLDEVQFSSAPLNTGIKILNTHRDFRCYPNPSDGIFNIVYYPVDWQNADYTVIDPMGRIIREAKISQFKTTLDLRTYPKGIYFIMIREGNSILSQKVLLD